MGDVIKIIKPLEDSGLLINGVYETIKNEAKEQKGRLGMLLGRLGISLLGYMLVGKGVLRARRGNKQSWSEFLMLFHPLRNFDIPKCSENELKFRSLFSRNNLLKIKKDEVYVIDFGKHKLIRTYWIALYANRDNVIQFDRFGNKHIPREIEKFIGNRNITTNIQRAQAYNSVVCRYFCIGFIDFMLKGKSSLHYTNLFSPSIYEKNNRIILKYFH